VAPISCLSECGGLQFTDIRRYCVLPQRPRNSKEDKLQSRENFTIGYSHKHEKTHRLFKQTSQGDIVSWVMEAELTLHSRRRLFHAEPPRAAARSRRRRNASSTNKASASTQQYERKSTTAICDGHTVSSFWSSDIGGVAHGRSIDSECA
jgi:hypothetical protein